MAPERVKIYCRTCDRPQNHVVCHEHEKDEQNDPNNSDTTLSKKYQTVECAGCETVSFRELIPNGSDVVEHLYPPPILRTAKNYDAALRVPHELAAIYKATMSAFNSGAENKSNFILCAGGIRCMLELICADLGIGGQNLGEKVTGLEEARHLTPKHTLLLQDARFLGNGALHQGKIPTKTDLDTLLDLFEDTINDLYVRHERFEKCKILPAIITAIKDDGVDVRVGTSTPCYISSVELGIKSSDPISDHLQIRQEILVTVMSDRDEQLVLSKKEADKILQQEEEKRRAEEEKRQAEEEKRKAQWEALKHIKQYELFEGTVAQVQPNGIVVKVTKGDTVVEGWVPYDELDPSRNQSLYQAYKLGKTIYVLVLEVVADDKKLILSKKAGDREVAFRNAEEAFNHRTILTGRVMRVAPDGDKLFVWIGFLGTVHKGQVGLAGDGEQVNLNEWVNQTIPVRVISLPDKNRKAIVQLSHRAALKRKEALKTLELGQQFTGKIGGIYSWGALVSVKSIDGVVLRADMASQILSKDDEIQVEVIKVDSGKGQLGLKVVSADTENRDTEEYTDSEDDVSAEEYIDSGEEMDGEGEESKE